MEALLSIMVAAAMLGLLRGRAGDRAIAARLAALSREDQQAIRNGRLLRIVADLGRVVPSHGPPTELARGAGMQIQPEVFNGTKVVLCAAGLLAAALFMPAPIITAPALAGAGYFAPDLALAARARRRREEIAVATPEVVELLSVCTRAGLNLNLALRRVSARTSGALGEELRAAVERMELGVPRATALRAMAEDCDVAELTSLVNMLLSSDKFGGRVAESLERLAADTRASQRRAAEEQARRAPVKMLFPLVLLILPAFVLLTIVPILIGALRGIGF